MSHNKIKKLYEISRHKILCPLPSDFLMCLGLIEKEGREEKGSGRIEGKGERKNGWNE
jgi:hypothetical protein